MRFPGSKKYSSLEDLVLACRRGEQQAQTLLYNRCKSRLMGVCVRYARTVAEADDIFHEAVLKVFGHIDRVSDPAAVDRWMKSVVVRTAINYYNRTTRSELRNVALEVSEFDSENDDYARIIDQLDVEVLLNIINALPSRYRIVINMYLIDGYSHAEIAEMLSIAESTSRSQYMRGRNLLIVKLQESGITENEI